MIDKERIKNAVNEIILAIGDNPERAGLKETPARVANMCEELFADINSNKSEVIKCFETRSYKDMVIVKNIDFYSVCEHHLMPFFGRVNIAYIPKKDCLLGLSKVAKIVDLFSKKLQLQETFTCQIADFFEKEVKALGVGVFVEAQHMCIAMRGIKKSNCKVTTMAFRGELEINEIMQKKAWELICK